MKYNGVIERKLDIIAQRVSKLRSRGPLTTAELEEDYFLRSGIERTLQVCVEAMIDIANRIIFLEGRPPSTESFASLEQLQDLRILEDAESYRNMVRFRNLIVHRYEQIETDILATIVNKHLNDFDRFTSEIRAHHED
ncbi:MAG: type VII toxin-antitoxin system HepT family RNase toxin [Verrucomicrobiota bacterium]